VNRQALLRLVCITAIAVVLATVIPPTVAKVEAAPSIRISLSVPPVINAAWTFSGTTTVSNQGTAAYCVGLSVSASSGFSVSNSRTSVWRLQPGESLSLKFRAIAPAYAAQGLFTATARWSALSNCAGTASQTQAFQSVQVPTPRNWRLSVSVVAAGAVEEDTPVVINLYDANGGSLGTRVISTQTTSSFGTTFNVSGPGTYRVQASITYSWPCGAQDCGRWPTSASKWVSVSGDGQSVTLYPILPFG